MDCSKGDGDIGPLRPFVVFGRGAAIRLGSSGPSKPEPFHVAFPCGLFRGAALGQLPKSPGAACTAPLVDWPLVLLTAVDVEDTDELDEMEEDELVRGMVFRGIKTPLTSSEFMEFKDWPPLSPHADRLMFAKLGGLATAVMRKDSSQVSEEDARFEWSAAAGQSVGVAEVVSSQTDTKSCTNVAVVAVVVADAGEKRGQREADKNPQPVDAVMRVVGAPFQPRKDERMAYFLDDKVESVSPLRSSDRLQGRHRHTQCEKRPL